MLVTKKNQFGLEYNLTHYIKFYRILYMGLRMGVCMSVKHFGVLVFVLETFPFFLSNRERPLLIGGKNDRRLFVYFFVQ